MALASTLGCAFVGAADCKRIDGAAAIVVVDCDASPDAAKGADCLPREDVIAGSGALVHDLARSGVRHFIFVLPAGAASGRSAGSAYAAGAWVNALNAMRVLAPAVRVNAVCSDTHDDTAGLADLLQRLVGAECSYLNGVVLHTNQSPDGATGRIRGETAAEPVDLRELTRARQTVIVTGASSGIGRDIAERLVSDGDQVVGFSRTGTSTEWEDVSVDVTDSAAVAHAVNDVERRYGAVDAVIAAAGIGGRHLLVRMSDAVLREAVAVNLEHSFHMVRSVAPGMLRRRSGSIVLVSSAVAVVGGPGLAAYAGSKAGLHGLTVAAAEEFWARGVRINTICPGIIDNAAAYMPPETLEQWIRRTPLGRTGTLGEVSGVAQLLIDQASRLVTGQVIPVDGGYCLSSGLR